MPSPRVLLRLLLILVLCADGIFAAWASTRMAVAELGHAASSAASHHGASGPAKARASAAGRDLAHDDGAPPRIADPGQPNPDHHDDCDCSGLSGCACSCMLTFFPGRNAPLFSPQHALASVYLAPPLLPPARHRLSPLFRPPIG